MKKPMAASAASCRRHPLLASIFALLFLLLVPPLKPFYPECVDSMGEKQWAAEIREPMSDDFRTYFKRRLRIYEVHYWDTGGPILIRALPFLYNGSYALRLRALDAAEYETVSRLVEPDDGRLKSHIPGYAQPGWVGTLRERLRFDEDVMRCDIMRPIVTGIPPEDLIQRLP